MGIILDIQKCSYHDGPGIRTAVFLKGCNLRCKWCHNPESFTLLPQLGFQEEKCILCGQCAHVCSKKVHQFHLGKHILQFDQCILCKECISVCPSSALLCFGKEMSAEEVIEIVRRDKAYYENSGGGVTFTGGEATLQQTFLFQLLKLSKENNLHTCLETNGFVPADYMQSILPFLDLVLLDYKLTDPSLMELYLGSAMLHLEAALQLLQENNKKVILRLPVIPGINDTKEHFDAALSMKRKYSVIQAIELMPYHTLGTGKWKQLGLTYELLPITEPEKETIDVWNTMIKE